jgi:hypothetical protein
MLAAPITFAHFSSSAMSFPKLAGDAATTTIEATEPRLDLGIGDACVDFPVEFFDDRNGRVLRTPTPNHVLASKPGQEIAPPSDSHLIEGVQRQDCQALPTKSVNTALVRSASPR